MQVKSALNIKNTLISGKNYEITFVELPLVGSSVTLKKTLIY
jgi:hypothetical protein